jgi:flagellar hook protein FlgE
MFTSFNTALSALNADTTAIDVVGNNLANLDTAGYKASVVAFSDLVTQSLGNGLGETQVGFGVAPPITIREFSQGAIQSSSNPLDVAIQGDGFLVVQDPSTSATLYTRGGNLEVNSSGELVTATGDQVEGWNSQNGTIDTTQPLAPLNVPVGSLTPPVATTNVSLSMNLDATATAGPPATTFSNTIDVYDSLGVSHTLTMTFTKTANPGEWSYSLSLPAGDVSGGGSQVQTPAPAAALLEFGDNGVLASPAVPTTANPAPSLAVTGLSDGAAPMTINWSLYDSSGNPQLTQYSQASSVSANSQNGSAAAQLTQVGIGNGGQILAQYSNGTQVAVGQLAMANVSNPESLIASGNNNYQLSSTSALPAVGAPNTGGRGSILGGSIESSTVDIATEFTNLIVYQRAYEANSKVVTTTDQLSQDTIALITT